MRPLSRSYRLQSKKAKAIKRRWYRHYYSGPSKKDSTKVGPKINRTRKRGVYFKVCRPERKALSLIEKQTIWFGKDFLNRVTTPSEFKTKPINCEYRLIRKVYYCILPQLFLFLWFPGDRIRLLEVEEMYYTWLNTTRFVRGCTQRADRLRCSKLSNPWLGDSSQLTASAVEAKH